VERKMLNIKCEISGDRKKMMFDLPPIFPLLAKRRGKSDALSITINYSRGWSRITAQNIA